MAQLDELRNLPAAELALLAPCWNWQTNGRYPLVPMRYPVFFRHFIGRIKPDRESKGAFDARFNHAYRHFCEAMRPERSAVAGPARQVAQAFGAHRPQRRLVRHGTQQRQAVVGNAAPADAPL